MVKSIINKSKKTHSKISVKEDNKKTSKPKVDIKKISKTAAETKEKPKIKKDRKEAKIKIIEEKPNVEVKKVTEKPKHIERVKTNQTEKIEAKPFEIILPEQTNEAEINKAKPVDEIHSLKELEDKILEKLEENKTEGIELKEEPIKHVDPKLVVKTEVHDDKDYKARVEAILFAVGKYLDDETIAQLCDMDKRHAKKALEDLKKEYDSRDTALMVVQEGNSWKINVREKYLSLVRKIVADTELSKSIMETLAVIAWKTPVYQNEIVRIRGNKCYDHIEELVNSGLVTKDKKGRSYVLKTTDKFYNYFDIDRKHLQGVMNEAKMPVKQTTLDEAEKNEGFQEYSREKLLHALDTIETKSIVQTEEDKNAQKQFLEQIHQKIEDASKRTDEVVAELPRPMHEEEQIQPLVEEIPPPLEGDTVVEKDEEDIVINTEITSSEHHFQTPVDQLKKTKSLTKKQLEKKFKEELQRVKEKAEDKQKK